VANCQSAKYTAARLESGSRPSGRKEATAEGSASNSIASELLT
jgi:hypothetical protein